MRTWPTILESERNLVNKVSKSHAHFHSESLGKRRAKREFMSQKEGNSVPPKEIGEWLF
jgi:hypothetical protein